MVVLSREGQHQSSPIPTLEFWVPAANGNNVNNTQRQIQTVSAFKDGTINSASLPRSRPSLILCGQLSFLELAQSVRGGEQHFARFHEKWPSITSRTNCWPAATCTPWSSANRTAFDFFSYKNERNYVWKNLFSSEITMRLRRDHRLINSKLCLQWVFPLSRHTGVTKYALIDLNTCVAVRDSFCGVYCAVCVRGWNIF